MGDGGLGDGGVVEGGDDFALEVLGCREGTSKLWCEGGSGNSNIKGSEAASTFRAGGGILFEERLGIFGAPRGRGKYLDFCILRMLWVDRWVAEYSERDDCDIDGLGGGLSVACDGCEVEEPSPTAWTCWAHESYSPVSRTPVEGRG